MNRGGWMYFSCVTKALECTDTELCFVAWENPNIVQAGRVANNQGGLFRDNTIEFLRATSNHTIGWVDFARITTPVQASQACAFSTICHTTSSANLTNILKFGLLPSGGGLSYRIIDPRVRELRPTTSLSVFT